MITPGNTQPLRDAARHAATHLELDDTRDLGDLSEVDYADAVSDVWEPVLREVLDMADGAVCIDRRRLADIRQLLGD